MPLESVCLVEVVPPPANVPLAPVEGSVKITFTPEAADVGIAVTCAVRTVLNAVPATVVCGVPPIAVTEVTDELPLVREKVAEVSPEPVAVTEYEPSVEFAVNVVAVAMPVAAVVTAVVAVEFANVPLAPVDGAVKVIVGRLAETGFP